MVVFFCSGVRKLLSYSAPKDLHRRAAYSICESCFLFIRMFIMIYLFVLGDSLTSKRFTTRTEELTIISNCYEPNISLE